MAVVEDAIRRTHWIEAVAGVPAPVTLMVCRSRPSRYSWTYDAPWHEPMLPPVRVSELPFGYWQT
jgi:hypothetical protein